MCTGNYYRSRFAEHLFNHLACERQLDWRAVSRGLSNEIGPWKIGPISRFTIEGLKQRKVGVDEPCREPVYCQESDLQGADLVIALKEAEHRPQIVKRFPAWEKRIEYWHIHDIDVATPEAALTELEALVRDLASRLATNQRISA
ncbi:MAG TPA: low molecular weight phosphatase family protein [Tepidisphaeraceae bacterium]